MNTGFEDGWTALHIAVFKSYLAIVQAILQVEGVNVNARTGEGETPLHMAWRASIQDQLPILQALLEAGADPNAADDNGETPLFRVFCHERHIHVVEALLHGGANPAARNNNLDTPLHIACRFGYGRLEAEAVQLLIQRQGSECLTLRNNREQTPLDRLGQSCSEVKASIRQHILQTYAGMLAQRDGLLCLHSVLQDVTFIAGNDKEFELPVGKLNTEHLQMLLEFIVAAEPGSVRTLDSDGLLPLQVASQLKFPDLVLNILMRSYPDALLQL